jgi:hypothetical protein
MGLHGIIIAGMAKNAHDQIIEVATAVLANEPQGIHTGVLIKKDIRSRIPDLKLGDQAIHMHLLDYARQPGANFYQPGRGIFRHTKFRDTEPTAVAQQPAPVIEKLGEPAFYQPFADWLVGDLEECTKAIPVGRNILGGKFGTPDVIGVRKPAVGDIIPAPIEVVCAEIKIAAAGLVTAFGQACSYTLFSHKSYIVVPKTASPEDTSRLESLCLVIGIGLILFDSNSPQNPNFEIRTRAARHEPDPFYVNEQLKPIAKKLLD